MSHVVIGAAPLHWSLNCVFQWTIFAIEPKRYIVLFNNLPYNIFGVWLNILAGRLAPIICNETMKLTYLTKRGTNGRQEVTKRVANLKDPNSEAKVKVLGSESLYRPEKLLGAHISALVGTRYWSLDLKFLNWLQMQSIKAKKCMLISSASEMPKLNNVLRVR